MFLPGDAGWLAVADAVEAGEAVLAVEPGLAVAAGLDDVEGEVDAALRTGEVAVAGAAVPAVMPGLAVLLGVAVVLGVGLAMNAIRWTAVRPAWPGSPAALGAAAVDDGDGLAETWVQGMFAVDAGAPAREVGSIMPATLAATTDTPANTLAAGAAAARGLTGRTSATAPRQRTGVRL